MAGICYRSRSDASSAVSQRLRNASRRSVCFVYCIWWDYSWLIRGRGPYSRVRLSDGLGRDYSGKQWAFQLFQGETIVFIQFSLGINTRMIVEVWFSKYLCLLLHVVSIETFFFLCNYLGMQFLKFTLPIFYISHETSTNSTVYNMNIFLNEFCLTT